MAVKDPSGDCIRSPATALDTAINNAAMAVAL
jgi:hypothetical protein